MSGDRMRPRMRLPSVVASDLAVDNPQRVHDSDPEVPDASAPEVLVVHL